MPTTAECHIQPLVATVLLYLITCEYEIGGVPLSSLRVANLLVFLDVNVFAESFVF